MILVTANRRLIAILFARSLTFVLCKKALDANNNDLKQAEQWLKEEVKRAGMDKSQKMTVSVARSRWQTAILNRS